MYIGEFRNFDQAYYALISTVRSSGFVCNPRYNGVCTEMRPASFVIQNPLQALYTGTERRLNYGFAAVESAMYIADVGSDKNYKSIEDTRILCRMNSNMLRFVNQKTKVMDGAYGPRLHDGLARCYKLLKDDMWSRQAVASIWNNVEKRAGETVDVPCTLSLNFFCTQYDDAIAPVLHLSVTMRSNDLNWGTPYDVAAFCHIQIMMAEALGFNVGKYYHTVGSLHFYDETPPVVVPYESFDHAHGLLDVLEYKPFVSTWDEVVAAHRGFLDECFRAYYDSSFTTIVLTDKIGDHECVKRLKKMMKWSWKRYDQSKQ